MKKFLATLLLAIATSSLALAQVGPMPSPWIFNGSQIYYSKGCVSVSAVVPGACNGAGSINSDKLYVSTTTVLNGALSGTGFNALFASPPPIGGTLANTGAFTTLNASDLSTLTGGFTSGAASQITGGLTVNTGGLVVSASGITVTGNSTITGTLGVTGLSTLTGGFSAGANSTVTGTLGVSNTLQAGNGSTNFVSLFGSATHPGISFTGGDANVNGELYTRGTGEFRFFTGLGGTAARQLSVTHTAAANRYVTITGSNGGSPAIGTSAGSLAVNAAILGSASVVAHRSTAIPAGGTDGVGYLVSSATNFGTFFGSGAPTLSAARGSLYYRSDGSAGNTQLYINSNGTTGWTGALSGTLSGNTSTFVTSTGTLNSGEYAAFDASGNVVSSGVPVGPAIPYLAWAGAPKTTNFSATAATAYCIDTQTTGAVTMTLPALPSDGDNIKFIDCMGYFATVNFTVDRNGNTIMGLAEDLVVNTNNAFWMLTYSSTLDDWRLN